MSAVSLATFGNNLRTGVPGSKMMRSEPTTPYEPTTLNEPTTLVIGSPLAITRGLASAARQRSSMRIDCRPNSLPSSPTASTTPPSAPSRRLVRGDGERHGGIQQLDVEQKG